MTTYKASEVKCLLLEKRVVFRPDGDLDFFRTAERGDKSKRDVVAKMDGFTDAAIQTSEFVQKREQMRRELLDAFGVPPEIPFSESEDEE